MPELPEVETYVRELEPDLQGRTVTAAHVYWPRIIAAPHPDEFVARIQGARFTTFGRRAKYMLLGLDNGDTLIVHLRMTGHLSLAPIGSMPNKHSHVTFDLDNGRQVYYNDPRKFGRLWLMADPTDVLKKLSVEPLGEDFSVDLLAERLKGRATAIKSMLLDQTVAAGVGNIYADESLFLAHIHPTRPAGSLTRQEITQLRDMIQQVLRRGIALQGSSLGDSTVVNYRRASGELGGFQNEFQVYDRKGQSCSHCGTPIERIVVGQRGTHFCPQCQSH